MEEQDQRRTTRRRKRIRTRNGVVGYIGRPQAGPAIPAFGRRRDDTDIWNPSIEDGKYKDGLLKVRPAFQTILDSPLAGPATTLRPLHEETTPFCINDHGDILVEVLKRLDARSVCVSACVCRLWSKLTSNDVVWEHLCFRHVTPPPSPAVRALVSSLGGYRRLYALCVEPALSSLRVDSELTRRVWTRHGAQLALSLFCVDYYERLGGAGIRSDASTSSLMFLCNPVNV